MDKRTPDVLAQHQCLTSLMLKTVLPTADSPALKRTGSLDVLDGVADMVLF